MPKTMHEMSRTAIGFELTFSRETRLFLEAALEAQKKQGQVCTESTASKVSQVGRPPRSDIREIFEAFDRYEEECLRKGVRPTVRHFCAHVYRDLPERTFYDLRKERPPRILGW